MFGGHVPGTSLSKKHIKLVNINYCELYEVGVETKSLPFN